MTAASGRDLPFDLVIFDLDGTLVDSLPDIAWSLNAALAGAGLPPLAGETVTQFVGDGAGKLIERALARSPASQGTDPATLLRSFVAHYRDHVCVDSRLFPGISDLLAALDERAVRCAVVTNKPHALASDLLEALEIDQCFAAVIGDGDGYPRKPDPTAARTLVERFAAKRTVIVGDGLPDIGMAQAVPCPIAAVTWGYQPAARLAAESPTFLVDSPARLQAILLPT